MSVMAKMNGNQGHGKVATNIWQVMNYQVPRGYVCAVSSVVLCLAPVTLLFARFPEEGAFFHSLLLFLLRIWTDESLGYRKCVHKVILPRVLYFRPVYKY